MNERIERIEQTLREETVAAASNANESNDQIVVETSERARAIEPASEQTRAATPKKLLSWIVVLTVVLLVGAAGLWWINSRQSAANAGETAEHKDEHSGEKAVGHGDEQAGEHAGEHAAEGEEIKLEPETLRSAGIEIEGVTSRPAIALLKTTGTIETDPQRTNQVSPLVGGRVETVNARVGEMVKKGDLLAVIASPQIAQMHGKMHEAETALGIAQRNLERVQRAENRAAVLQAKARLDESEATLKRTRRLIELGAGAGKDLIAAETAYKTAKADFDFQSNISLNREIQEARAAAETARVDLRHIQDEMRALGANPNEKGVDDHSRNSSLVPVYAPAAGMITERPINPGAGVEAGTTLFVLSNLSSVYAVASVPETQMPLIRIGTAAQINSPALAEAVINARVAYIDPQLNEDTRTGKVRLELPNPGNRLRAGMFVEVGFQIGTNQTTGAELVVPSSAVQRIGERTVVFVPVAGEAGTFRAVRIETGGETDGYTRIREGLELGQKVVTKGSFTLKTQLQKGELGDHDH